MREKIYPYQSESENSKELLCVESCGSKDTSWIQSNFLLLQQNYAARKISHYFRITWELSISYSRGFSLFILYHFLYIRTCYIFVLWIYINIYISFCITFFIRLLLKGACKLKYSSYSVFLIKLGLYKKSFLMLQLKIALSLLFSTSFHQKYKEYELQ